MSKSQLKMSSVHVSIIKGKIIRGNFKMNIVIFLFE